MSTNQIILMLVGFCVALFSMLLLQRAINAGKLEELEAELFAAETMRIVEVSVNNTIIELKDKEITKLKRQLTASEKLRKDLMDKRWEEEALT